MNKIIASHIISIPYTIRQINNMSSKEDFSHNFKKLLPGAIASLITQPLEVIKTNMINSPTQKFAQLHGEIVGNGYRQYMRGTTVAMLRQAYGFAIYTHVISKVNQLLKNETNKFYTFSLAAISGKLIAMVLESPLTLLKTRMEVISSSKSIKEQVGQILKNPKRYIGKGLTTTLGRECIFSLIHYNLYRIFKDEILADLYETKATFISAFMAAIFAITLSQPLEVIRSRVSITLNLSIWECGRIIWIQQGWKGFIVGYIPRLLRKPINSGICWTLIQKIESKSYED